MKSIAVAVASLAFLAPLAAQADTSPLVNRVIVQQALQQQMQNQLNLQASQLQAQQDFTRAALQAQMQQEILQLQYLQLQQQLNLVRIQTRSLSSHARKSRHHK
jgi:opacity protein-like surface antigen